MNVPITLRLSIAKPGTSAARAALAQLVQPLAAVGRELVGRRAEHGGQLVQQDRVDLGLVVEDEVEVVVPGAGRRDRQPAQQHRGGRARRNSSSQRARPVARYAGPDAALFQQLAGLAVDRLHPADRVGPDVRRRGTAW